MLAILHKSVGPIDAYYPPKKTFPADAFPLANPSIHHEAQSVLFLSNMPLPEKCWQGVHVNFNSADPFDRLILALSHQSSSMTRSFP